MVYKPAGLSLFRGSMSGQDYNKWLLDSEDAPATVRVDGYVSDGQARGMRVGDLVELRQWTTFTDQYTKTGPILAFQLLVVLSLATTGDAVDLSDGTAIAVTDTD